MDGHETYHMYDKLHAHLLDELNSSFVIILFSYELLLNHLFLSRLDFLINYKI